MGYVAITVIVVFLIGFFALGRFTMFAVEEHWHGKTPGMEEKADYGINPVYTEQFEIAASLGAGYDLNMVDIELKMGMNTVAFQLAESTGYWGWMTSPVLFDFGTTYWPDDWNAVRVKEVTATVPKEFTVTGTTQIVSVTITFNVLKALSEPWLFRVGGQIGNTGEVRSFCWRWFCIYTDLNPPTAPVVQCTYDQNTKTGGLSWTEAIPESGDTVTGYCLQRATNVLFAGAIEETIKTCSKEIVNLPGGTYYYRVKATDAWGTDCPWSNVVSITSTAPTTTTTTTTTTSNTNNGGEFPFSFEQIIMAVVVVGVVGIVIAVIMARQRGRAQAPGIY